jgi:ectoine hydroxylase-related dioxygenase (phytanoyl-CoA dioxygenase family)
LIRCSLCGLTVHGLCLAPPVALNSSPSDGDEWHCYSCRNLPKPFWTCWIPLGDLVEKDGRLALIPASHALGGYERPQPRGEDVPLLPGDYTPDYAKRAVWCTPSSMRMGDLILFNVRTVHAATRNDAHTFRLSIDTRVTTNERQRPLDAHRIASSDPDHR